MVTANQWVSQQEVYNDYEAKKAPKKTRESRKKAAMSAKDRGRVLLLLLIAGFIGLMVIVASAYGASVNYSNNNLKSQNTTLQGEVDSIDVKIQSANNIAAIEEKATKQLSMVYPEGEHFVEIQKSAAQTEETAKNFASLLREQAFN